MKKKPKQQTAEVIKRLVNDGFRVDKVEHWNQFARKRKDLFNFIDLIAMKPNHPLIGIQVTSRANVPSRVKKILSLDEHRIWLSTGCLIWVVGLPRVVEIKLPK